MNKFAVTGGKPLQGDIRVGGAKNVAMKAVIAALFTEDDLEICNIPLISSVLGTAKIVEPVGVNVELLDHTLKISARNLHTHKIPLELGGLYRSVTMAIGPLLARTGKAIVPNPGGCRLGKRPVNWHIQALEQMGAKINYKDGFFYAEGKLHGSKIKFVKNTHTGTETIILAAVLADGETLIENAAEEPEVDDLIFLLNQMGANIKRHGRVIKILGVKKMHGTKYSIMPDRNEAITYAIAAIATKGSVRVTNCPRKYIQSFLEALDVVNAGWEAIDENITRFYYKQPLKACDIITSYHPGFMTDWQAPWAVLATQANGISTIHETVFEHRFAYIEELKKMGAKIEYSDPEVKDPVDYYNFNWLDRKIGDHQGIKIFGPTDLHDAVMEISDLRAGATLVLAALTAKGTSILHGTEHIDRGYENFDTQLKKLGAEIKRIKGEI